MLEILKEDIHNIWDPNRFAIPHRPHSLGLIPTQQLAGRYERVLDMPIRLPGGEFHIPYGDDIKALVEQCHDFERAIYPDEDTTYCYLTIDQGLVKAGNTQRNPGVHFDGMQGPRYKKKLPADHFYFVSTALPTIFYEQGFETKHLNPATDNWYTDFERQAKPEKTYQPKPFELVFATVYCPHECARAEVNTERVFIRIQFSHKIFDRAGNSINPLLNTGWTYVPRPIPTHLV